MILIADSGATKTDWYAGDNPGNGQLIETKGINPFHLKEEEVFRIIREQLVAQLANADTCTAVYFYGAGCIPEKTGIIRRSLEHFFPRADIHIYTDLLGAARAVCGKQPGIACILGTGSNSCLYDGEQITDSISPLGYILGDEGSGAYIGKRFIADCLKRQLPREIADDFCREYKLTPADILDRVYRQPQANLFLSAITPYIYRHKEVPEIQALLIDCFMEFFRRNILQYKQKLPVSFVGSIACFFEKELQEAALRSGLHIEKVIKQPINSLIAYHWT